MTRSRAGSRRVTDAFVASGHWSAESSTLDNTRGSLDDLLAESAMTSTDALELAEDDPLLAFKLAAPFLVATLAAC